jgi:hypothetical protein
MMLVIGIGGLVSMGGEPREVDQVNTLDDIDE